MKKFASVLAISLTAMGLTACNSEPTASDFKNAFKNYITVDCAQAHISKIEELNGLSKADGTYNLKLKYTIHFDGFDKVDAYGRNQKCLLPPKKYRVFNLYDVKNHIGLQNEGEIEYNADINFTKTANGWIPTIMLDW